MSTIRAGVIGLGFAGQQALQWFHDLPGVEVVALAGLEEDRLATLGAKYGVPHLFAHHEELLALEGLDVLSIGVPNQLHAPIAIAALERGLHVLCEKPLARTGVEAEVMVRAARSANRVLQVVFNHRERGDMEVLKRYVDEGHLGRVYHARAYWMRRRGIPRGWFVDRDAAGGGCLIDLGVHVLDMAMHLLGNPEVTGVSAATYDELGRRGIGFSPSSGKTGAQSDFAVEDMASAFLRLSGGATLQLDVSWAAHGSAQDDYGVVLNGTDGGAEIRVHNYETKDTLRIYTNVAGEPAEISPWLPESGFHRAVVRAFVGTVRSGRWSDHDGSDGLRYARIIDACYASAELGREVPVPG